MKHFILLLTAFIVLSSCSNNSTEKEKTSKNTQVEAKKESTQKVEDSQYDKRSVDDNLAKKISDFLINDYLKNDIAIMSEADRKFQFFKVDLNSDGNNEVFVRFMSSYFCGSGGCTFLLLDNNQSLITTFSVTRAPIFVENTKVNGWRILLVKDSGVFKELTFKNGTYPNNPSMVKKAPYDAPSSSALVMFDENYGKAKTYSF